MGRMIRSQKQGRKKSIYRNKNFQKKGEARFRPLDYAEREGFITGVVREIIHDPGRGAPLARVVFRDRYKFRQIEHLFVAVEGMYTGMIIQCGQKAALNLGNILPLSKIPEGTSICNVEFKTGDKGCFARASGTFVTIIAHAEDGKKTMIKLPSKVKKTISSKARAMIGIVGGGGRIEKPILKAGNKFWMYKTKRKVWPKVRGVAMNPVDHPHGGGNQQHLGRSSCVSRYTCPGRKVGLIAARRTGLLRGGRKMKFEKNA